MTGTITRIYGTSTAETDYLDQIVSLEGNSVILGREDVRNGSGRVVGESLTVTDETAEFIRECIARGD